MNIIICDSDLACTQRCETKVDALARKHGLRASVDVVPTSSRLLFEEDALRNADLVYLEEDLPDARGVDTAMQLRRQGVRADIVFYTCDETRAIDGYDVEALHYVVKGKASDQKFEEVFLKAVERSRKRRAEVISLSCAGEHRSVDVADILYFEVRNRIVTVRYKTPRGVESFDFYSTLSKIEELLFNKGFERIHRAYLVKKTHIARVVEGKVELMTGESLPIGRTYKAPQL